MLCDISQQLQQTEPGHSSDLKILIKKLNEAVHVFKSHARQENEIILPLIFEYEPSIWDALQMENRKDGLLIQNLESALQTFMIMTTLPNIAFSSQRLQDSFAAFTKTCLEHIAIQEQLLNDVLWRYFDDEILMSVELRLQHNLQKEHATFHQWNELAQEIPEELLLLTLTTPLI